MPYDLLCSFTATGGYRSVTSLAGPDARPDTIWRGSNLWLRAGGRLVPVKGPLQLSTENLGARIFAADIYRAELDGGLIGSRLPKAALVRYNQSALFFVSELTGQQVRINESTTTPYTMTGVVTSATASKLRVAVMNGTSFLVYNAGLQAPPLRNVPLSGLSITSGAAALTSASAMFVAGDVGSSIEVAGAGAGGAVLITTIANYTSDTAVTLAANAGATVSGATGAKTGVVKETGGSKAMDGAVSIVQCARRISTDSTSNPGPVISDTMTAASNHRFRVTLGTLAAGQDGWLFAGTDWGRGTFGPWKVIREVRAQPDGQLTVTNGGTAFTGVGTRLQRDARPGDMLTVGGVDAIIATITSDTAGTFTAGFVGLSGTYSTVAKEVVLEWRNGELGEPVEYDNDVPPLLDGLMLFNTTPFGWRGNVLYPSKIGNPEAFPAALARSTQSGGDIIWALAGDNRIYLLTTNSLEVVTFTQNPDDPFLIRQAWSFGFSSPTQAVIAEGSLYAAIGTTNGVKIVRTRVDDSPDLEFSADVESDMAGWAVERTVLAVDPTNGAVLAMQRSADGAAAQTTVLPYMLQLGRWSLPQTFSGRVTDAAQVNNDCALILFDDTNYRVWRYEGGSGSATSAYAAWPYVDLPVDWLRKVIKRLKLTGRANTLKLFVARPGAAAPLPESATPAASWTLGDFAGHEAQVQTNVPNAQSYCVRVDTTGVNASFSQIDILGLTNPIGK